MDRKISEKNTRNLVRLGKTSLVVTIPRELVLQLGWREGQRVTVKKRGKGLLIEDWPE